MENVFDTDFDQTQDEPGYRWDRIFLGRRLGGEMLGASVFVLPPGEKSFPYHVHRANEELLLVLDGQVDLRTPAGVEPMTSGDAVLFRRGEEGAHQVINSSDAPARFIMFSTLVYPEVAHYPDSGNIGVIDQPRGPNEGLMRFLDGSAERDYYEGR